MLSKVVEDFQREFISFINHLRSELLDIVENMPIDFER